MHASATAACRPATSSRSATARTAASTVACTVSRKADEMSRSCSYALLREPGDVQHPVPHGAAARDAGVLDRRDPRRQGAVRAVAARERVGHVGEGRERAEAAGRVGAGERTVGRRRGAGHEAGRRREAGRGRLDDLEEVALVVPERVDQARRFDGEQARLVDREQVVGRGRGCRERTCGARRLVGERVLRRA